MIIIIKQIQNILFNTLPTTLYFISVYLIARFARTKYAYGIIIRVVYITYYTTTWIIFGRVKSILKRQILLSPLIFPPLPYGKGQVGLT